MTRAIIVALLLSLVPLAAQAQSSRCERMPTEEEYQRCIEREGSDADFDPRDIGSGSTTGQPPKDFEPVEQQEPPKPIDTLPPESRKHVQKEMTTKVYAKVGEWTPETRDTEFEYDPSEAAKADAKLRAQEEAAFAEAVEEYHKREEEALASRSQASQGAGDEQGEPPEGGNLIVRGKTQELGTSDIFKREAQSRDVYEILGDFTAKGEGKDFTGEEVKPDDAPGERITIDGDVVFDRDERERTGGGLTVEKRDGASGGNGADEDDGSAGQDESVAGSGAPPEDVAEASGAPGLPSSSERPSNTPPPTPPRPIPSADAIASDMLEQLFDGEGEEDPAETFSDAPFVDWSNPDPQAQNQASEQNSVVANAADVATQAPMAQPSGPAPDPETLERQIAKEAERLETMSSLPNQSEVADAAEERLADLRAAQPASSSTPTGAVSATAAKRISVMDLP
ncbi:MAG: hypothetical protein AAF337_10525 [Pseudomonadota bacterium]